MPSANILYLHSHDTGRFIQPYGHPIRTPNLQKFAEQGVVFRQAFCANPTCSPSRAALLTGQYPHNNGMLGLAHRGFTLNDYRHHLLHALKSRGYTAALAGIQHIANPHEQPWQTIGYDHCLTDNPSEAHTAACGFLDSVGDNPFFLSVGFFETHRKFPAEPEENPDYCMPPPGLPDTAETRLDMARYKASARRLDEKMGAVLEALDRNGLAENTLVICTTDHGIAFPGMKCNLTDAGTGVMLMMRGPGGNAGGESAGFTGGRTMDGLVSHVDIFPTVCDVVGIEKPEWLEGVSLLPMLDGREVRESVFAEVNVHACAEPMRSVRTRRWKYIRRFHKRRRPYPANCDDSPSKDVWLHYGFAGAQRQQEELYDLVFDPHETCNLAAEPRVTDILDQMRARLDRWMHDSGDPLADGGSLRLPSTAVLNAEDGLRANGQTLLVADDGQPD